MRATKLSSGRSTRFPPFSLPGARVTPDRAVRPHTGSWRSGAPPTIDFDRCVDCLLCWAYCPDVAIRVEDGVLKGIDESLCKGCGVCAAVCPQHAIAVAEKAEAGTAEAAHLPPRPERTQPSDRPSLPRPTRRLLTGAAAVAEAMRQVDPDVVPVYPITPQTAIVEAFAEYVADGLVHTELVAVESEHSALTAAVASALSGARAMTATASQGLAYMVEILYVAAGLRAPVVLAVANRSLSAPINIHGDHSDAMLARDSGALQLFAENAQEAYDLIFLALRLAEHPDVLLPAIVNQDGFTTTHTAEPVALLPDDAARAFVGEYRVPTPLLDTSHPVSVGAFAMPDSYFEVKLEAVQAQARALALWPEVAQAYRQLCGRLLEPLETYRMEGARRAFVVMGSAAGTVKEEVDNLREQGEAVGVVKLRAFRPFPRQALQDALAGVEEVAVLERALSPGGFPPLFAEVAAQLLGRVHLMSFVFGLGGRELLPEDVREAYGSLIRRDSPGETRYLGVGKGGS